MIPEFVDFCKEIFPSINPYTAEQAKEALKQFENHDGPLAAQCAEKFDLLQGDYYSEIPFVYVDENGEVRSFLAKAQLLSNTCDAVRDDRLLFAAVRPISDFEKNEGALNAIKENKRYSLFYVKDNPLSEYYVDFELITSMSREMFNMLHSNSKVKRIATLTMVGYYMFISKLTS